MKNFFEKQNHQRDKKWMDYALILANKAKLIGEVPVGAILIFNNNILGSGFNQSISLCDPTAHAELIALREGGKKINNYRLINTTLYVTLEPCLMCLGAIINSRINRLVVGTKKNSKDIRKSYNIENILKRINNFNIIKIDYNICHKKCNHLIRNFFKNKRN